MKMEKQARQVTVMCDLELNSFPEQMWSGSLVKFQGRDGVWYVA